MKIRDSSDVTLAHDENQIIEDHKITVSGDGSFFCHICPFHVPEEHKVILNLVSEYIGNPVL